MTIKSPFNIKSPAKVIAILKKELKLL